MAIKVEEQNQDLVTLRQGKGIIVGVAALLIYLCGKASDTDAAFEKASRFYNKTEAIVKDTKLDG